jgi:hypothetical protein
LDVQPAGNNQMINDLTPTQRDLAKLMSEISESAWRAVWMQGLEYELWTEVQSTPNARTRRLASPAQLERLSQLSGACGGWITFDQEQEEVFVAFTEWTVLYDSWCAS